MNKRITWTLGSLGAAALIVGAGIAVAIPAQASSTSPSTSTSKVAVEDGTNDGETADDVSSVDESNAVEGADDTATNTGTEDGTNDGETAYDTVSTVPAK